VTIEAQGIGAVTTVQVIQRGAGEVDCLGVTCGVVLIATSS
jgi:hypothetical protein